VCIEQLRQLGQRRLALHGSQCHRRLECRTVDPAGSSAQFVSCHAATFAAARQKIHLSPCADFPGHLSHSGADRLGVVGQR
jgi:hypothetical protein